MVSAKKKKHAVEGEEMMMPDAGSLKEQQLLQQYINALKRGRRQTYIPMQPIMKTAQEPFKMTTPYKVQMSYYGYNPQLSSYASTQQLVEKEKTQKRTEKNIKDVDEAMKLSTQEEIANQALPLTIGTTAPKVTEGVVRGSIYGVKKGVQGAKSLGTRALESAKSWVKGSTQGPAMPSDDAGLTGAQSAMEGNNPVIDAATENFLASEPVVEAAAAPVIEETAAAAAPVVAEAGAAELGTEAAALGAAEAGLSTAAIATFGVAALALAAVSIWWGVNAWKRKKKQKKLQQAQEQQEEQAKAEEAAKPPPPMHNIQTESKQKEQEIKEAVKPR